MRKTGFTLVELMIVILILGLLAVIAIPAFVKARNKSQQNACINTLRQIDGGKCSWAMAAKKSDGDSVVTASINAYVKGSTMPICPAGGTYTYGNIGSNPDCNFEGTTSHNFVGPSREELFNVASNRVSPAISN